MKTLGYAKDIKVTTLLPILKVLTGKTLALGTVKDNNHFTIFVATFCTKQQIIQGGPI